MLKQLKIEKRVRVWVLVGTIFLSWSSQTHNNWAGTGDEPHFMMIAQSLFFDRDLELSNNYNNKSVLIMHGEMQLDGHTPKNSKGKYYSSHQIGMPILFAPYYGGSVILSKKICSILPASLLKRLQLDTWQFLKFFLGFAMAFLTGCLLIQIFDICFYLTGNLKKSLIGALLTVWTVPIFCYSFLFYTEILNALIPLWICKQFIIKERIPKKIYALIGFLLGYSFFIHLRSIGIITALFAIILWRFFRQYQNGLDQKELSAEIASFLIPFFLVMIAKMGLNLYLWDRWFSNPVNQLRVIGLMENIKIITFRFFAEMFDQEHGLLLYAPLYILAIPAWLDSYKRFPKVTLNIVLICFSYLIFLLSPITNADTWSGDWSPGSRLLIPILPMVAIPIILFLSKFKKQSILLYLFMGWHIAITALFWQFPKLFWNIGDGTSNVLKFLSGVSGFLCRFWPSYWVFSNRTILLTGILLILFFAGAKRIIRMEKEDFVA